MSDQIRSDQIKYRFYERKNKNLRPTYHLPCHSTFGYPACFMRVARFGISMGIALGGPGEPVLNYKHNIKQSLKT